MDPRKTNNNEEYNPIQLGDTYGPKTKHIITPSQQRSNDEEESTHESEGESHSQK